jgi:hypothetical protein
MHLPRPTSIFNIYAMTQRSTSKECRYLSRPGPYLYVAGRLRLLYVKACCTTRLEQEIEMEIVYCLLSLGSRLSSFPFCIAFKFHFWDPSGSCVFCRSVSGYLDSSVSIYGAATGIQISRLRPEPLSICRGRRGRLNFAQRRIRRYVACQCRMSKRLYDSTGNRLCKRLLSFVFGIAFKFRL